MTVAPLPAPRAWCVNDLHFAIGAGLGVDYAFRTKGARGGAPRRAAARRTFLIIIFLSRAIEGPAGDYAEKLVFLCELMFLREGEQGVIKGNTQNTGRE
jgi:hypothetical protein